MNDLLVSIIVPVYNVEDYLRRCLDSIINQTYKNLEIILVDDGSTDKSGEICDEYKKEDKRIIVIHQKNQGVSVARNAGLDIFKGEYVSFIDSDDYVDSKFIETLLNALLYYQTEISACSMKRTNGIELRTKQSTYRISKLHWSHCVNFIDNSCCNKLFKSELFDKKNRFCINMSVGEDAEIVYKLLITAQNIAYIKKPLYYYFYRECSATHSGEYNFYIELIDSCKRIILFRKNDISRKILNKYFRHLILFKYSIDKAYKNRFNNFKLEAEKSLKNSYITIYEDLTLLSKFCYANCKKYVFVKKIIKLMFYPFVLLRRILKKKHYL